ncbi:MAG: phospholipase D-like domain-containing protein [Verrucomicrobia bacterium]|nr:phospholipase D-like domain-containing protein [Verrucomicrobiota bacterium]MDA1068306.1 phospholipase D-like domain-containing protein [Verrucomicrobiota bacterium]
MAKEEKLRRSLRIFDIFFLLLALSPLILPFVMIDQPLLPDGAHCESEWMSVLDSDVELLIDSTAWDSARKQRVIKQEIFDELLDMIARADQFIVLDFFLWNHFQGTIIEDHRKLSTELASTLIKKKRAHPDLPILLLTDPINRIYGNMAPAFFKELEDAGVRVVFTHLWDLPDSNWIYGTNARFYSRFTPNPNKETSLVNKPWVTNPLIVDGPKISLKQLGHLLFFKANHRKVAITASQKDGVDLLVSSLNPADGSSAHSNMGIRVRGSPGLEALDSELKLITWSHEAAFPEKLLPEEIDHIKVLASELPASAPGGGGAVRVKWITEGAIRDSLIELFHGASNGDEIMITLFYLSDREVIAAIKQAAKNGAKIRMVLDANRDAFGREKNGIPNRIVAGEFRELAVEHNISIVWADTHGEQFHNKAVAISNPRTGKNQLCLGSANWTRRNIGDLNLEANVWVEGSLVSMDRFRTYFETLWKNPPGLSYTLDLAAWEETGWSAKFKSLLYRVQEWTGLCTF